LPRLIGVEPVAIVGMLDLLTRKWRLRAASLLVVLYALCLVAPTAVLAFSAAAAHCLTDDHHGVGTSHVHEDGSSHRHSGTGHDEKGQADKCCGLFCVSAMVTSVEFFAWQHPPAAHFASFHTGILSGRGDDRIDRPPRSLLSL
jgi:hypothetical protein